MISSTVSFSKLNTFLQYSEWNEAITLDIETYIEDSLSEKSLFEVLNDEVLINLITSSCYGATYIDGNFSFPLPVELSADNISFQNSIGETISDLSEESTYEARYNSNLIVSTDGDRIRVNGDTNGILGVTIPIVFNVIRNFIVQQYSRKIVS